MSRRASTVARISDRRRNPTVGPIPGQNAAQPVSTTPGLLLRLRRPAGVPAAAGPGRAPVAVATHRASLSADKRTGPPAFYRVRRRAGRRAARPPSNNARPLLPGNARECQRDATGQPLNPTRRRRSLDARELTCLLPSSLVSGHKRTVY